MEQLESIIDTLLAHPAITAEQVLQSGTSFVSYILPVYANKDMVAQRDEKDIALLQKVFQVITRLYTEHPMCIEKSNLHVLIIESLIPFLDRTKFPLEIVDQASLCIIPIISAYAQVGDLKVQKYITQQRKTIFKRLDSALTRVLQSITNSNSQINEYESMEDFELINTQKISKLSISIRLLTILVYPLTFSIFLSHLPSKLSLESYINQCWFCLKSVVVNESFSLEDPETVEIYDELYAKLLQSTVDFYYGNDTPTFSQLQLLTSKCKELLNWSLFSIFPSTHIVLSQCLLKLAIKLQRHNNLSYLWTNLKLTADKREYVISLLEKKLHIDLKHTIAYLFICDSKLKGVAVIDKTILHACNRKYEVLFTSKMQEKLDEQLFFSSKNSLDSYHEFNYTTAVEEYLEYWANPTKLQDPVFRFKILNTMSKLSCHLSGHMNSPNLHCDRCHDRVSIVYLKGRPPIQSNKLMQDIYEFFINEFVAKVGNFDDSDGNLTINIITTMKTFFTNFRNPQLDDVLWKFIQNCFTNVFREVRLLITTVIPLTLAFNDDLQYEQDLKKIISLIKSTVPNETNGYLFEGLLVLIGELLSTKSIDSNYHYLLTRLIDFLSDTDEFRVNLSMAQIRRISQSKGITPWKLVEPFIAPVSINIMENITTKPSLLKNLCIALEMPEWLFIEKTTSHTVPVLFYKMKNAALNIMVGKIKKNKNQTKIQKISDLINQEIIGVVAHSLVYSPKNPKVKLMKLLTANEIVDSSMDFGDLMENISPQLPLLIFRILSFYSKADTDRIKKIINAIGEIAVCLNYGPEGASRAEAANNMNDRWLLTIVQLIFTTISDVKGSQPFYTKLCSMRALVCLSEICPSFETCLNQIMNGLQVALQYPELQKEAMLCWEHIFDKFSDNSKLYVIDPILCQLFIKWDSLSLNNQGVASNLIFQIHQWCSRNESTQIKYWLATYYSNRDHIPALKKLNIPVAKRNVLINNCRKKLKCDNDWVKEHILDILIKLLSVHQLDIHSELAKSNNSILLKKTLIDISQYITSGRLLGFNGDDQTPQMEYILQSRTRIISKSAHILSLIGNIDMGNNGVTSKHKADSTIDNVNNFMLVATLMPEPGSEHEIALNNLRIYFVQNVLVKLLITSINPEQQKLLSCTIHDCMQMCDVLELTAKTEKITPLTANILYSLKTEMASWKKKRILNLSFPIYNEFKVFNEWFSKFSSLVFYNADDLFTKTGLLSATGSNILNNIPHLDMTVAKFAFPYIFLAVIAQSSPKSTFVLKVYDEIMSILEQNKTEIYYEYIKEEWKKCVTTILELIQFMRAWANKAVNYKKKLNQELAINNVLHFLERFDPHILAKRSADCGSYEGSVFYLESGFKSGKIPESEFSNELKDMYVELEDFDQLQGVLKLFSDNNLNDMLLKFKYNEDPSLSNQSLTAIAQFDFNDNRNQSRYSKSVVELLDGLERNCEYDQLLLNMKNFEQNSNYETVFDADWSLYGLQASIFSGDINELEKWASISENFNLITTPGSDLSIFYQIARALIQFHKSDLNETFVYIDKAVQSLGLQILNVSKNHDLYNYTSLLHGLHDFKLIASSKEKSDNTIGTLRFRQNNSVNEFKCIWKIHSLRAAVYKLHPVKEFQDVYQNSLIGGSRILRENRRLAQASKLLTKALILNDQASDKMTGKEFSLLISVEFSQLLWSQGDYQTALKRLSKVIESINSSNPNYLGFQLTYLKWLVESSEGVSEEIRREYMKLTQDQNFNKESDVYYQYGNYLNKLLDAQKMEEGTGELELIVVRTYLMSIGLAEPTKDYIYEIFPKAITTWLDFYSKYDLKSADKNSSKVSYHDKLNEIIRLSIEKSDINVKWYIILTQIMSRITHPSAACVKNIQRIIVRLSRLYPSVLLYSVFSLEKSVQNEKQRIAHRIAQDIMKELSLVTTNQCVGFKNSNSESFAKIIREAYSMIGKLASCCLAEPKKGTTTGDLFNDYKFDPTSNCPYLALPIKYNFDQLYKLNGSFDFVSFAKFDRKVTIFNSLQHPKKISLIGNNGRKYGLLLKKHDDLRKDRKVMEFANVMNSVLRKDHEAEKRGMQIGGYAATPLNEKMGIIEWVFNYKTLRSVLLKMCPRLDKVTKAFKEDFSSCKDEKSKVALFQSYSKKLPPKLSTWMTEISPNVSQWYDFRTNYSSSLSVMSIVGYLVGIGDRHLDNVMISETTGNVIHIDFDCIFEKGKTLKFPEIVPFRLTQNLIDGLGVLKYEGKFRKVAELTLSKMRENENLLMNLLESFVYEPLEDWSKLSSNLSRAKDKVYTRLRNKIKGILTPDDSWTMHMNTSGLSISVNLHVDLLIQSATSDLHLSEMYIGWSPLA